MKSSAMGELCVVFMRIPSLDTNCTLLILLPLCIQMRVFCTSRKICPVLGANKAIFELLVNLWKALAPLPADVRRNKGLSG